MNRCNWAMLLCLSLGLGCQPSPTNKEEKESMRVETLQGENKRLREELLTARKEAIECRTELSETTTALDKSRAEKASMATRRSTPPVPREVDPPETPEQERFDASCNAQLKLEVQGDISLLIPSLEGRLKGWGLQRIQVLNGREESTLDIFFAGPKDSAKRAKQSMEGAGTLTVHGLEKTELSPFDVAEILQDFRSLFPEEGSRIKLNGPLEEAPFATSVNREDIVVFSKQVIHRAPKFAIFPAPAEQPGIWRSRTVAATPWLTNRELKQATTTQDEQGTSLFLRFLQRGVSGLPTSEILQYSSFAFVLDGTILRVLSLPREGAPTFERVEFNLPYLPLEEARIEIKRVASLLAFSGRLPIRVLAAEEECIDGTDSRE